MKSVKKFHAKFGVKHGDDLLIIHIDFNDWVDHLAFIKEIAKCTGVKTMGDVIQRINAFKQFRSECIDVRFDTFRGNIKCGDYEVYDWDMMLE